MLADGQTNRQTDTLITVTVEYCTPPDRYPYTAAVVGME